MNSGRRRLYLFVLIRLPWNMMVAALAYHLGNVFRSRKRAFAEWTYRDLYSLSRQLKCGTAFIFYFAVMSKIDASPSWQEYGKIQFKNQKLFRMQNDNLHNCLQSSRSHFNYPTGASSTVAASVPILFAQFPASNPSVDIPFDTNNNKNINWNDKFVLFAYKWGIVWVLSPMLSLSMHSFLRRNQQSG